MARRLWITADTHFGEPQAIARFGRPFSSTEEMDRTLLDSINRCVDRKDELLHVGDFCGPHPDGDKARRVHARTMRDQIRCKRVSLIRGNHDVAHRAFDRLFTTVTTLQSWRAQPDDIRVNACHWPLRLWRGQFKGAVLLHGHSHGGLAMTGRSVDVGMDCWNYQPIEFAPLLDWLKKISCVPTESWPRLQCNRDPSHLPDLPLTG